MHAALVLEAAVDVPPLDEGDDLLGAAAFVSLRFSTSIRQPWRSA
jgi:hypothetical protein